jgi:twitching motility protein PilI
MEPTRPVGDSVTGTNNVFDLATALASASLPHGSEPETDTTAIVHRMGVRVGDLGLLFSSDDGREVMTPPVMSRLPNTVSWLRGLANVRGDLVPVVDLAVALDVSRQPGVPGYLLILVHGDTSIGLLIDGLPRLFSFSAAERVVAPMSLPPLLRDSAVGAYAHAGRHWFDVDLQMLYTTLAQHIARA